MSEQRDGVCNERQRCDVAEMAAEQAVRKVFAMLGVDVNRPESLEQFREDLRFGGRLRRAADRGFMVGFGAIVVAMLSALWFGIVAIVKNGGGHG